MIRLIKLVSFLFLLSACAPTETGVSVDLSATPYPDLELTSEVEVTKQQVTVAITETSLPVSPTDVPPSATATLTALPTNTVTPSMTATTVPSKEENEPTPLPKKSITPSVTTTATAIVTTVESPTTTVLPSATTSPPPILTRIPSSTAIPAETKSVILPSATVQVPTVTIHSPTATAEVVTRGVKCFTPPENYERVQIRGHTLSKRTVAMMNNAQELYGGIGSMQLVIQGSYSPGLGASFGTHDGGGSVDIWTVSPNNTTILLDDIDNMVWALRQSGFAAWFRPANMLYQGMYPHIHAISIGDKELSAGATSQLTGEQGYFRGRNGLPQPEFMGFDPHDGPILCPWMEKQGYQLLPYDASGEAQATEVSATKAPATEVPATKVPATEIAPTTEASVTEVSATEISATEVSATEIAPTQVPATKMPVTEVPATETAPTQVPATEIAPTSVPATEVPPTEVSPTEVLPTEVPPTEEPPTKVPATEEPPTEVPATETPAPTAVSCQQPVDDYRRINVNGQTLSQRTYKMLETAQVLYGGLGNLLSVTQGSYNQGVTASFGTHDGGGAVDISIRSPQTSEFLYDEVSKMVFALRQAGFAAWYRSPNEGFAPHIHAIAVGDAELSEAASAQLIGEQGYFRGRNGLLDERAASDPHGGPWVCDWMKEMGYRDLR